uniref:Uncharacterized protein n=1 Tax=Ditylenchus dipsaci TaxID=166011 RepID=A0A915E9X1_9BILA
MRRVTLVLLVRRGVARELGLAEWASESTPSPPEPIRLLLHYAGQKFEDVRIPRLGDEWRELKKKFLKILPWGKDAVEKARVDELHDWNRDIFWQLVILYC